MKSTSSSVSPVSPVSQVLKHLRMLVNDINAKDIALLSSKEFHTLLDNAGCWIEMVYPSGYLKKGAKGYIMKGKSRIATVYMYYDGTPTQVYSVSKEERIKWAAEWAAYKQNKRDSRG